MIRSTCRWLAAFVLASALAAARPAPRFIVTFPAATTEAPLSGRLILVLSPSPRVNRVNHVAWDGDAIPFFGMDVDGMEAGPETRYFDAKVRRIPAAVAG